MCRGVLPQSDPTDTPVSEPSRAIISSEVHVKGRQDLENRVPSSPELEKPIVRFHCEPSLGGTMSKATHEAGITKALEGETVQWKEGPGNRQVKYQDKAACEQKNNGRWHSITHSEGFASQVQQIS